MRLEHDLIVLTVLISVPKGKLFEEKNLTRLKICDTYLDDDKGVVMLLYLATPVTV